MQYYKSFIIMGFIRFVGINIKAILYSKFSNRLIANNVMRKIYQNFSPKHYA